MRIFNTDFWTTFESDYNSNESFLTPDRPKSVAVAPLILPGSNGLDRGPGAFCVQIWTLKSDVSFGGKVQIKQVCNTNKQKLKGTQKLFKNKT